MITAFSGFFDILKSSKEQHLFDTENVNAM